MRSIVLRLVASLLRRDLGIVGFVKPVNEINVSLLVQNLFITIHYGITFFYNMYYAVKNRNM